MVRLGRQVEGEGDRWRGRETGGGGGSTSNNTHIHVYRYMIMLDHYRDTHIHVLMRDEERSKQGQTNNKAKQHSTPKTVTFPKKN